MEMIPSSIPTRTAIAASAAIAPLPIPRRRNSRSTSRFFILRIPPCSSVQTVPATTPSTTSRMSQARM